MLTETDSQVRFAIYQSFAEGVVPSAASVAAQVRIPQTTVHESYRRLHEARAIVLDGEKQLWMAPPFAARPTPFRVVSGEKTWFAPCAWDAFGIVNLIGCDAESTTACPDCQEPIVHRVVQHRLIDAHGVVHFAVPAARWWDNIGYT